MESLGLLLSQYGEFGLSVILLVAIIGGYRGWWVFGNVHREMMATSENNHESQIALIRELSLETAKATGKEMGIEIGGIISEQILKEVEVMIDRKFRERAAVEKDRL